MPATATHVNGAFSWNELMTNDPAASRKFYGELLGWKFRDMPMSGGEYSVATLDGSEEGIAGIMKAPAASMPTAWGSYVTVDDVDARAALATKLGGKVLVPAQDVPTVGRFCVIQDPQGAMVALITYEKK